MCEVLDGSVGGTAQAAGGPFDKEGSAATTSRNIVGLAVRLRLHKKRSPAPSMPMG